MNIKKVERKVLETPISFLANVIDYHNFNTSEMLKIPGKLKTLLGIPNYISINYEDWFGYYIEYDNTYLEIYGSALETRISGLNNPQTKKVISNLVALIQEQTPTEYEWTGYYMDYAEKVTLGLKNNTTYQKNEQLKLNDEEWQKLYCKVYQIAKNDNDI